ncbi:MAG: hypothetical protein JW737_10510 [Acidobacteria bacterium]|nr:hypothetical protein [Acidobacteriota bacterium]
MKYMARLLFLGFLLCLFYGSMILGDTKSKKLNVKTDTDYIMEGDQAYAKRSDAKQVVKAVDAYRDAWKANNNSYEAMWKLAKAYWYWGNITPEDDDEKRMDLHQKGKIWAQSAMKANPKGAEGFFWYGVNLGAWGEANGVTKSLSIRGDLEEFMKKTVAIDPVLEGGGAYRVLGRLKFRLPGLFGGDNDESIAYLKKAIEVGPTNSMNYIFLAETLMDEDDYKGAKDALEKVINMQPDPRWIPETEQDKKRAKELLKEVMEELED